MFADVEGDTFVLSPATAPPTSKRRGAGPRYRLPSYRDSESDGDKDGAHKLLQSVLKSGSKVGREQNAQKLLTELGHS